METVYFTEFQTVNSEKDWISEDKCCCSLSSQNILAVSRQYAQVKKKSVGELSVQYEVGLFDLDRPWEWYQVMVSSSVITCLEWDKMGNRLLIADADGKCQIWQMQASTVICDFLLNRWTCHSSSTLEDEEILAVAWFHNGVQVTFNPEKCGTILYNDKFQRGQFVPSLTKFGGKPVDGWIAVTASGLVCAGVVCTQEPYIEVANQTLSQSYQRLSLVSIAHTGKGEMVVAASDGQISTAIHCYKVSLSLQNGVLQISCKPSASFFAKSQVDYAANDSQRMGITQLYFLNQESSETVLVSCGSHGYSSLEIWQLLDHNMPVNSKLCQYGQVPDTVYHMPKWMHKATIQHSSYLTSIATPRLPLTKTMTDSGFSPYIATAYRDGTLKLIHRHTYQVMQSGVMDTFYNPSVGASPTKKPRKSVNISNLVQTMSGCGLVAVHDGKISVLKVFNVKDGGMMMSASYVCLLLEYILVAGQDWWDILLAVKPGNIESICMKLLDNFYKQPAPMQDLILMRLSALRVAMYSMSTSTHQKAADYHTRLVLQAIHSVFRALLRPKAVTTQDKSPAEKVTMLCQKSTDGDLENLLVNLEVEEFLIDPRRKDKKGSGEALQSLQPLIQWVADFSLHLLASIPLYQSYSTFPGASLLSNSSVLNTLRELLVIIRIWGVISPASLPVFATTSNVDCLAHLFKVMTKAWLCSSNKEGNKLEYDEALLDECCVLPSKVLVPSVSQDFRLNSTGYSVFTQHTPVSFVFGEQPEYLYHRKKSKMHYVSDVLIENGQHHDIVRQIHLGAQLKRGLGSV
ncbi:hypothetical protein FSP39_023071 [Pinctada imbricata]|uniref:Mediator of RNA polymerase II transcription subunit 16 n=1 Tax=Pinctada imbricata TaxID=66713 RepID=A0AA88Y9H4_PINIB|nr:hypothetical protein FSP39_023071 [Pinctada imbricata]